MSKKRNIAQREADLEIIARLYLEGRTQQEIAQALSNDHARPYSLTGQTISNDLRLLKARWKESSSDAIAQHLGCELAKLDHTEREAWQAWHNSKAPTVRRTMEAGKVTRVTESSTPGDPRFLTVALQASMRRAALLGLDDAAIAARIAALEEGA